MMRPVLHVLTDPDLSRGRSHAEIATAALAGGVDVVQLRDKHASLELFRESARELRRLVSEAGRTFVVNDRLDVAIAVDAHGLHLGPLDGSVGEARGAWLPPRILGASARSLERARALAAAGADYLGVGPVFGTTTKRDAPGAIGLSTLREIAAGVGVPVIAIGGIHAGNAALAIEAGAAGVAVISAVVAAADVEAAVAALRRALDDAVSR